MANTSTWLSRKRNPESLALGHDHIVDVCLEKKKRVSRLSLKSIMVSFRKMRGDVLHAQPMRAVLQLPAHAWLHFGGWGGHVVQQGRIHGPILQGRVVRLSGLIFRSLCVTTMRSATLDFMPHAAHAQRWLVGVSDRPNPSDTLWGKTFNRYCGHVIEDSTRNSFTPQSYFEDQPILAKTLLTSVFAAIASCWCNLFQRFLDPSAECCRRPVISRSQNNFKTSTFRSDRVWNFSHE